MGDVFQDRLDASRAATCRRSSATRSTCPPTALRRLRRLQEGDRHRRRPLILATPPGFRPLHLAAAVAAGKHIFTEKPVAVDGPGIRTVLDGYEEAKTKNLAIVAGTQRRHQAGYLETMKRIHDGAIGDIIVGALLLEPGQPLEQAARGGVERHGVAAPQLALLHLALRRPHRRAARPQPRRHQLGDAGATRSAPSAWAAARSAPAPSTATSSTTSRSTTSTRTASTCMSMCRQIAGCENNVSEALVGHQGHVPGQRRQALRSTARTRVAVPRPRDQPLRAGAHRPDRQHPRRQAAQRAEDRRREHPDGDHGPHVGLHRQGGHLGAGAGLEGDLGAEA